MKNKNKNLFYFLIILSALFILPEISFGIAGGDILWERPTDPTSGWDVPYSIAIGSDGIYIAGTYDSYSKWRVEKRTLDATGGTDGNGFLWAEEVDTPWENDGAYAITVDSTGVYVAGCTGDMGIWRVERRSLDGSSIIWQRKDDASGFDINGAGHAIAVDSTGVYVAGAQNNFDIWRVEKRNLNNGNIIWQKPLNIVTGAEDVPWAIAIGSDGVYVVGAQNNFDIWRVEKRNLNNGNIIWQKPLDFDSEWDIPYAITVDSTGVYVAGARNLWDTWRVEKRTLNGSGGTDLNGLIWEKEVDNNATAYAIAVDSTGVYVAGNQNGNNSWCVEKRDSSNGSIVWVEEEDINGLDISGNVFAIAIGSDGVYVVGAQNNFDIWRVEKREKTSPNTLPTAINRAVSRQDCCLYTGAKGYFEWTFSDSDSGADQYFYEIEIDDDLVIDPALDPGDPTPPSKYGQPGLGYNPDNPVFTAGLAGFPNFAYTPDKRFPFNQTFYWRLRVEDDQGGSLGWINGPDLEVGLEAPNPDFLCNSVGCTTILPAVREQITLVNTSQCCDAPYPSCSYVWDFDTKTDTSGDGNPANDQDSTLKDPSPISYSTAGIYTVRLTTTNNLDTCFREHNINVEATTFPLPQWREIAPF